MTQQINENSAAEGQSARPALLEDDTVNEMQCWCGAKGTYNELFDSTGLDSRCHGSGILSCHCGGDLCVCHHHGETECMGCPDCEDLDDDDYYNEDRLIF